MKVSSDAFFRIGFLSTLKFIVNKQSPSLMKCFVFLLLFSFSMNASAKTKTLHYVDENYTIAINSSRVLFLFGPWGEDPKVIDRPVSDAWGEVGAVGAVMAYQKRDEIDWGIFNRESGEKMAGGVLMHDIEPEQGLVKYVVISLLEDKANVKIAFDTDDFFVYMIDKASRQKLLRQGKLEKR